MKLEKSDYINLRLYCKAIVIKTVDVVTQKQKYRLMEKDRKSRDRLMHLWLPNL